MTVALTSNQSPDKQKIDQHKEQQSERHRHDTDALEHVLSKAGGHSYPAETGRTATNQRKQQAQSKIGLQKKGQQGRRPAHVDCPEQN